jgi:hypothetical protein
MLSSHAFLRLACENFANSAVKSCVAAARKKSLWIRRNILLHRQIIEHIEI